MCFLFFFKYLVTGVLCQGSGLFAVENVPFIWTLLRKDPLLNINLNSIHTHMREMLYSATGPLKYNLLLHLLPRRAVVAFPMLRA